MSEDGLSNVAYFRLDGGSSKLYTQEYVDKKDKEIERLNNELKSDENYYVRNLKAIIKEKDKEIERLTSITNELEKWCYEELKDGNLNDSYYGGMHWKSIKTQHFETIINKIKELKGEKE